MLSFLKSFIVNQVVVPGSLFWNREKRNILRRWKRALLLPETILLALVIVLGGYASEHFSFHAGPQAMAASGVDVIQDGVPTLGAKRKQRHFQDRLRRDPNNLVTLTSADMLSAFSYADLTRRDGDVSMLQFRGDECVLDVFMDGSSPSHYEFRVRQIVGTKDDSKVQPRACIDDILKSRF